MNNLITRLLIGIIGVPAILGIIYLGNIYFLAFLIVISMISQYEFYKIFKEQKKMESYSIHAITFGALWLVVTYYAPEYFFHAMIIPTMLFLLLNLRGNVEGSTQKFAITLAGYLYIPLLLSTLLMIRGFGKYTSMTDTESWRLVIVLFVSVWINDTFAYIFGSLFGKNKLAPKISPNKSREGSFAGIIGVFFSVFIFYYCKLLPEFFTIVHVLVLSLILGVIPQ